MIKTYLNITLHINCNVFPKPHEHYGEFITNFTSYHDNVKEQIIYLGEIRIDEETMVKKI